MDFLPPPRAVDCELLGKLHYGNRSHIPVDPSHFASANIIGDDYIKIFYNNSDGEYKIMTVMTFDFDSGVDDGEELISKMGDDNNID